MILGLLAAATIAAAPAPPSAQDEFTPCADAASAPTLQGSRCARFRAPVSYADPSLGTVELFVRKFPAKGRPAGRVWLVAGGPGESGASFYPLLPTLRAAFPRYDLIAPDHRGTGFSGRLCPAEEARDSPGGLALEGAEWASCFATLESRAARTQAFTISNAARDLSGLMGRYGGEGRTVLYGVSYGTQLVLRTMVIAPPARLDAIVLDSLIPPETSAVWDLSHRSEIVDQVGRRVLADCDADATCRAKLGGSAVAAARRLIDDAGASAMLPGGRPGLFLGALLDHPRTRPMIPDVIAAALAGDPAPVARAQAMLEALGAPFNRYPQASASIPLVSVISASENNARPDLTRAMVEAEAEDRIFASSLPGQLVGGASRAYPRDAAFGQSPAVLPPTLVLQGDMDPKTPHEGAVAHMATLGPAARLVTVRGAPHFLLFTAPDCFIRVVRDIVAGGRAGPASCDVRTWGGAAAEQG